MVILAGSGRVGRDRTDTKIPFRNWYFFYENVIPQVLGYKIADYKTQ
jgi:hypothetical protein